MNALLARFAIHGRTHDELHEAARGLSAEERDDATYSIYELWLIESDRWPGAIARLMCRVHDAVTADDQATLRQFRDRVDEILPEVDDTEQAISLMHVLEDVLDLPVWKHRHEVYAIWLGAQLYRVLRDNGWHFRFHLVDDRLEFAFRGVHLATLWRGEREPELYWWTELRSDHSDLPNSHRTKGIQPDYRVLRAPMSMSMSMSNRDILVLEAKQHLRSSNKEFREAVEDYAHACPLAGVLLANYGPCSTGLMAKVASEARTRSAAHGHVHPGQPKAVGYLREDIDRVVDAALKGNVASAFRLPYEITLTWGAYPADLDLHLFQEKRDYLSYSNPVQADAELSTDVTSGHGPEIATLHAASGVYIAAVHQFSDDSDLSGSKAIVEITWGPRFDRSLLRFEVPAGVGRWWHVASIDLETGAITALQVRNDHAPAWE
jgi:hypothetical protein